MFDVVSLGKKQVYARYGQTNDRGAPHTCANEEGGRMNNVAEPV